MPEPQPTKFAEITVPCPHQGVAHLLASMALIVAQIRRLPIAVNVASMKGEDGRKVHVVVCKYPEAEQGFATSLSTEMLQAVIPMYKQQSELIAVSMSGDRDALVAKMNGMIKQVGSSGPPQPR